MGVSPMAEAGHPSMPFTSQLLPTRTVEPPLGFEEGTLLVKREGASLLSSSKIAFPDASASLMCHGEKSHPTRVTE